MKVYFIPFTFGTYDPISRYEFRREYGYKLHFYGKHDFIEELRTLLESEETEMKIDDNIRMKVEFNLGERARYYVDQRGIVEKDSKENFIIPREALWALEKKIMYFHGVVDKKPTHTPTY